MVRSRDELRFPGFSAATRAFYTELDASPDGSPWPDGAREIGRAHV